MRRFLSFVVLASAIGFVTLSRVVASSGVCNENASGASIGCGGGTVSVLPGAGGGAVRDVGSSSGTSDDRQYFPIDRLVTGRDGQPCVTTGYLPGPAGAGTSLGYAAATAGLFADYAPCPADPAAPVVTPAMVAARFWEEVPLPEPAPHIAPGRVITGKWAYLETRGELRHTFTQDTPLGSLEITATGAYQVDWGDGETTGPYDIEGGPWPDGEIRHTYIWAGSYDVVVIQNWTATWSLGSASGTLRQLRTEGRIDDLPAEEIQAVREN